MSSDQYQKCLSWSLANGLNLDSRIERKKVNGVYGMYATEAIPRDTVVTSFPVKALIPKDGPKSYPNNFTNDFKVIYTAALELSKGEKSQSFGCVSMFETLEELKTYSFYYFEDFEFDYLQKMDPILHRLSLEKRHNIEVIKNELTAFDPSLNESHILQAALNFFSRVWGWSGDIGFLPVLDLFNHSDRKGNPISSLDDHKRLAHRTRIDYKKGEQIYVSYSRKDMANFALSYNYFDSEGTHFIDYSLRVIQTVQSAVKQKVFEYAISEYGGYFFNSNGSTHFKLQAKGLFFLETGPSYRLLDYFRKISQVEANLNKQVHNDQIIFRGLLSVIDPFLSANNIESINLSDVPVKLHRFYYMLIKEREILVNNRNWVFDNI